MRGLCSLLLLVCTALTAGANADATPFGEISFNPETNSMVFDNIELNTLVNEIEALPASLAEVRTFAEGVDSMLRQALAPKWAVADNYECAVLDTSASSTLTDVLQGCIDTAAYDLNELLPLRFAVGTNATTTNNTSSSFVLPLGLVMTPDGSIGGSVNQATLDSILPSTSGVFPVTIAVANSLDLPAVGTRTLFVTVWHEVVFTLPGNTGIFWSKIGKSLLSGDGSTVVTCDYVHDTNDGFLASLSWGDALNGTDTTLQTVEGATVTSQTGSWFSYQTAVSSDGCTALVGAQRMDSTVPVASEAGGVVVLSRPTTADPWAFVQVLRSDLIADDQKLSWGGISLSADGAVAVVSNDRRKDPVDTEIEGGAQVFRWNGTLYERTQTLLSPEVGDVIGFGLFVAVSGDGSFLYSFQESPSVGYVFKAASNGTYVFFQAISDPSGEATRVPAFTHDGTRLVVPWDNGDGYYYFYGYADTRVTVFEQINATSGFVAVQDLYPSEALQDGLFGYDIALSGDGSSLLISAPLATADGVSEAGIVGVYTWSADEGAFEETRLIQKLVPESTEFLGLYMTISYDGTRALVATYQNTAMMVNL